MSGKPLAGVPALPRWFPAALALAALLLAPVPAALAGGPLVLFFNDVDSTFVPYAYPPGTVDVHTDLGPNGMLTNAESDTLVAHALATWSAVPTSYFSAAISRSIEIDGVPTDINQSNVGNIVSTTGSSAYNGGGIDVIYDTDGTITSNFFGAPAGVAGISSPEFADTGTPNLLESWTVLNGSLIDPGDTSPYPGATFGGVYTHEFGHAINLAHSQTNGAVVFYLDDDGASGCGLGGTPDISQTETMCPFIDITPNSTGIYQAVVDQLDDIATLSSIYPAAGWGSGVGTITGRIMLPDSTEVTGVNVIARNLADPLGDAVSALSGDHTQGGLGPDGRYTLTGLTPGQQYAVYVDAIVDGGFSTDPTTLSFQEEYWNGVNESGDLNTDNPCEYDPILAAAGDTTVADFYLNYDPSALNLGDDTYLPVALPFPFSFCGTAYDTAWVGANGFVTFGQGDEGFDLSAAGLLAGPPRIVGMWTDLDPTSGGSVSAKQVGQDFVIAYNQVPMFLYGGSNTFSITLRPDGTHQVAYGYLDAFQGVAGRSPGGGAADPGPTDLSAAAQPLGAESIYQEFNFDWDLNDVTLEFSACGAQVGVGDRGLVPTRAALFQSRPNPFRSGTVIAFDLPRPGRVRLRVFNLSGRLVTTLVDGNLEAGSYSLPWRGVDGAGSRVAPGIYFYRLDAPGFTATRKTLRVQ